MEVFVVHIYHGDRKNDKKNPHCLIGIVEDITDERKKAFRNYDELWEVIISKKDNKRRKGRHIENARTSKN